MARVRISEFRAKQLLFSSFGKNYQGVQVSQSTITDSLKKLDQMKKYVVKVDEGIKGRFKKGLVAVDISYTDVPLKLEEFKKKGFGQFLIEEYVPHDANLEKYLSIELTREGKRVFFSKYGGVDVEKNKDHIRELLISSDNQKESLKQVVEDLECSIETIETIFVFFDDLYLSFLEINPLIVMGSEVSFLDAAIEVDSTAQFFVQDKWTEKDFVTGEKRLVTKEEKAVKELASKSTAAFSLTILNPHGRVGMLLSSGGASIVIADEVGSLGFGEYILNYGEYSGGPSEEETYLYAKNILSLLLASRAQKKVLLIAGGVANFTDIKQTFKGVIRALAENVEKLQKQNIKVFVRRGGPNQEQGLKLMKDFLEKENIYGLVGGPELSLTDVVKKAIATLK